MRETEKLVVIHLSATAIYVVIGHVNAVDDIRIMAVSEVKSEDYQCGVIKHWDRLKSAIKQAIIDAEEMANCRVHSVWLTLSTPELLSTNSHGKVEIETESVETRHIVQALSAAKKKDMPVSHYLMHHCQQGILVDDHEEMVDDAIDMYANNIVVMYHLMMMPVVSCQNIQKLIQACDVTIDHILFDAVSTAEYSLIEKERNSGACLIDIGASTTSVCVYSENRLVYTYCLPEGSHTTTMDISSDLGITMAEAELLKKRNGRVDIPNIDAAQFVTLSRTGAADDMMVNVLQLAQIIEARYIALMHNIFTKLNDAELLDHISAIVLSGGGSQIRGMVSFSKRYWNMPVYKANFNDAIYVHTYFEDDKLTSYLNARIKDRALQTAFGALLYSQSEQFQHSENSSPEALEVSQIKKVTQKLQSFLQKIM